MNRSQIAPPLSRRPSLRGVVVALERAVCRPRFLLAAAALHLIIFFLPVAIFAQQTPDVWTDQSGDHLWKTGGSLNWSINGAPGSFSDGDAVLLDDTAGPGHYNVTLPGAVSPSIVDVVNSAGDYAFGGSGSIGGSPSLAKYGAGQLTIANTSPNTASTVGVNQGTLRLNLNDSVPTNPISSNATLVMNGGSLLAAGIGNGARSQTFGQTFLEYGNSSIAASNAVGGGTTLALGSLSQVRSVGFNTLNGATVDFKLPGGGGSITTVVPFFPPGIGHILGGYATVNGVDWATTAIGPPGPPVAVPITALSAADYTPDLWGTFTNTTVTANSALAPGSGTNSLRFNNSGSYTLTLSNANAVVTGGILETANVGAHDNIITGGSLGSSNNGNNGGTLFIIQNNTLGSLTIDTVIQGSFANLTDLVKSGPGTVVLTGANTYNGSTSINGGVLSVRQLGIAGNNGGVASPLGQSDNGPANLIFNGGTLRYTGPATATDRQFTLLPNGGTLDASGTGPIAIGDPNDFMGNHSIHVGDGSTTLTLTGSNTDDNTLGYAVLFPAPPFTDSLVKDGPGTWVLAAPLGLAQGFSGSATIKAGTLKITTSSFYAGAGVTINGGMLALGNNTSVSGGAVAVNDGGRMSMADGSSVVGPVTVNGGGAVSASGAVSIFGAVAVKTTGRLSPDGSTMALSDNLTIDNGAVLDYSLGPPNHPGGDGTGFINVAGALNINPNLTLNVDTAKVGKFILLHYGTDFSGSFSGWRVIGLPINDSFQFVNDTTVENNAPPRNNIDLIVENILPLRGDLNLDGHINGADVSLLLFALTDLNAYQTSHNLSSAYVLTIGDVNSDGKVSNADLQALLTLLKSGGGSVAVPEPASLVLLALGLPGLAFAVARRPVT